MPNFSRNISGVSENKEELEMVDLQSEQMAWKGDLEGGTYPYCEHLPPDFL